MREKLKPQRLKRKIGKVGVLSLTLLAVAMIVQLVASNTLAGKGETLKDLEKEASRLSYQNQLLGSELAEISSLSRIASQSAELGLGRPETVIYVDLSQPVAVLP